MASLIDLERELGTDEQCLAYLEAARWPSGFACLKCGSVKVVKSTSTVKVRKGRKNAGQITKTRHLYDCLEKECGFQFTATTGTIFHDTHLPLVTWFKAVAIFLNAKKSLSAYQLQRDLGIHYRSAWHLLHRIREAMGEPEGKPFTGKVEVDETHVGGRFDKRRQRGPWETTIVAGMIERANAERPATVRATVIPTTSAKVLSGFVRQNISRDAALYTDQNPSYTKVGREYRVHGRVNHIALEYVRGEAHTNSIEGFWSLFKRAHRGSWHHISPKHLPRYLAEFVYRHNHRSDEDLFGLTVCRLANGNALPYAKLTGSEPS